MDVFDLFAKIKLDSSGYEKGLNAAKELGSKVASGITTAFKASTAAVGAASTALTALVKSSLSQYANYEQLVGGVNKIFGDASKKVQEYANRAYETAGLSANEYMETVTSFSASLLQSLSGNTEMAADVANRAIRDMSDNANTYGTDMASIQNAYQGFAKQNYTMLDNLKLGYGGTKEEMERLIRDAAGMNKEMRELGVTVDADSMSFDNIINAISVMQKHLEITNTTADEAGRTISGSLGSMRAAWKNFLTGVGTPEQFTTALVGSVQNVTRQLKTIVPGLVRGLKGLAEALAPEIPKILIDILPTIIDGAAELLQTGASMLPEMIQTLVPPSVQGTVMVMSAIVENLPEILQSLADALPIVLTTLMNNSGGLLKAGKEILGMIGNGIVYASENIGSAVGTTIEKIGDFLTNTNAISKFMKFAGKISDNLVKGLFSQENLEKIVSNAPVILDKIGEGVVEAIKIAGNALTNIVSSIVEFLFGDDSEQHWSDLILGAAKIIEWIGQGCLSILGTGLSILDEVASGIAKALGLEKAYEWGKEMLKNLARGAYDTFISPWWNEFWEEIGSWFYDLFHFGSDNTSAQQMSGRWNEQFDPSMMNMYESPEMARESFRGGSYQYANNAAAYAAATGAKGIPVFGKGGIVTKPTLAVIGDAGAEAVVPLEKDSDVGRRFGGSTYNVTVNMTVNASNMGDIENASNDMIRIIDSRLRQYQVQQVRGQGGMAW